MVIRELLNNKDRGIFCIHPEEPIFNCIKVLNDKHFGALVVVCEEGKIIGIISERDIMRVTYQLRGKIDEIRVKDIMTPRSEMILSEIDEHMNKVMERMSVYHIRHMPIVNNLKEDKLVGLIAIGDVITCMLNNAQEEIKQLQVK